MLDMLKKFNILNCKTISTPINISEKLCNNDKTPKIDAGFFRRIIGSLMYLTHTRPKFMFSTSMISRFMCCPSSYHLGAAKGILNYIFRTMDLGIHYHKVQNFKLVGYSKSDWAGSCDDRKNTSVYMFNLGSGAVAWTSKKQEATTLSSS